MNKLNIPTRIGWSLLTVFTLFLAPHFGYAASPDDFTLSGLALAGVGSNLSEITDMLEKQGTAMQEFIKRTDEKYNKLDREFLEFQKKANRIGAPAGSFSSSYQLDESKKSLADFIRSRGETKMMESAVGPSGGWSVNPVLAEGIGAIVRNTSALRQLVNFIQLDTGDSYEELLSISAVGADWVGERSDRPETASPNLVKVTTRLHELYANPVLTQRLADDSGTAMVDFLINETALSFAEAEELALFSGLGVISPRGLAMHPTAATADATRPFGTIEHIPTGVSGALHATTPMDAIKDMFFKLRAGYRTNAVWVCNSEIALLLSKVKDDTGNFLWDQGNIKENQPVTLLGKPVVICETSPAAAANSLSLWFGDWNQALRAIERPGNKVLLDPFSQKPNLQVYVYRRTGLSLRNSNALKVLKFAAA
ncbi:MAG: phage major capsid protein [Methylococcaceae bacterium]